MTKLKNFFSFSHWECETNARNYKHVRNIKLCLYLSQNGNHQKKKTNFSSFPPCFVVSRIFYSYLQYIHFIIFTKYFSKSNFPPYNQITEKDILLNFHFILYCILNMSEYLCLVIKFSTTHNFGFVWLFFFLSFILYKKYVYRFLVNYEQKFRHTMWKAKRKKIIEEFHYPRFLIFLFSFQRKIFFCTFSCSFFHFLII